jgi:transposase
LEIRRVDGWRYGTVKQEKLDWLADTPFYPARVSSFMGRRCQTMTVKDVAQETHRAWWTIMDLAMAYLREPLRRASQPAPNVVGIDEIFIRKGHTYRIVVSDLEWRRPIWFGGNDRSEERMDEFYQGLGSSKSKKIRLAVMDMWKACRNAMLKPAHAPQAAILFDKFHVIRHLGAVLDAVRQMEYDRLTGKGRRVITGQKYTRLSHREHLKPDGWRSLRLRLKANTRLNTAVPPQGGIRAALGRRAGRLGASFLRELESVIEVAAAQTLREVRRDDRPTLGRHRGLWQAGEHGCLGVRRGTRQQDSRHAATQLWAMKRGVPAPQDPYVHA